MKLSDLLSKMSHYQVVKIIDHISDSCLYVGYSIECLNIMPYDPNVRYLYSATHETIIIAVESEP